MKWEISVSNMEFSHFPLHGKNTLNTINIKITITEEKKSFNKHNKNFEPSDYYKKLKKKPTKHYKKFNNKKTTDKRKIKCFKCEKYGHFVNNCKVKQKINQLQINVKEREDFYKILEWKNTDNEKDISPNEYDSSSTYQSKSSSTSYSPNINFGCNNSCCKTVNVLTKSVNVLTI